MFLDTEVAFKTLAQFKYAHDIADFLAEQGIKGIRTNAASCAVSEFMNRSTGRDDLATTQAGVHVTDENGSITSTVGDCTSAMTEFVRNFDNGKYPQIVREWGEEQPSNMGPDFEGPFNG